MTGRINDGGPAFPIPASDGYHTEQSGMTLRDWFAGQALAALYANPTWDSTFGPGMVKSTGLLAYEIADAMIAARGDQP